MSGAFFFFFVHISLIRNAIFLSRHLAVLSCRRCRVMVTTVRTVLYTMVMFLFFLSPLLTELSDPCRLWLNSIMLLFR